MCSKDDPITIRASGLRAVIDEIEYAWFGGFGAVIASRERGLKQGECRMIGNVLFYVHSFGRGDWSREVHWIPVFHFDAEWMCRFKAAMFGVSQ